MVAWYWIPISAALGASIALVYVAIKLHMASDYAHRIEDKAASELERILRK